MLTSERALVLTWVIQETATLIENARERRYSSVASDVCDGWRLDAQTEQDKTHLGIFLMPIDLKSQTRITYEFKATSEADKDVPLATYLSKEKTFKAGETSGWGFSDFLDEAALKGLKTHKLVITCKITWADGEAAPSADRSDFFDKFEFSDVAVVAADAQPPIFLQTFMLRKSEHFESILDSEFSESISTARLSPPSGTAAPGDRFRGDTDEFAAFSAEQLSEEQKPQQDSAASENNGGPAQAVKRRRLTSSTTSGGGDEQKNLRDFRLVKVPNCSYATLAAYLRYLYSSSFEFLPSPAVFLAEEKEAGSLTKSEFSKWADDRAESGNYPTFPHAMYRLADCYMEPKVKERAKGWIRRNITVETAPFELFSQLSLDYSDVQGDVVDFVLANLDGVLATPGWERAVTLVNEGKIPDGAVILNKLLSKARKAAA